MRTHHATIVTLTAIAVNIGSATEAAAPVPSIRVAGG